MRDYLDNAWRRSPTAPWPRGARQLVAVLAERRRLAAGGGEADEIAEIAETELGKLAPRSRSRPVPSGSTRRTTSATASTLDVGTPRALQPSVILTYNMGRGRSLVAGAAIAFGFERGGGSLTAAVNTNDLGQATCSLGRLDSTGERTAHPRRGRVPR